jgi:ABC-type uncharacterized transport system auxiliary subunit
MTLPGSDTPPTTRYLLHDATGDCRSAASPLSLSVVRANAGLETERIARRDRATGEVTYLAGVRWADQLPSLLEQQMARDLECSGFAVMTGHHKTLAQSRLVCEVRAFNLVEDGGNRAEAWLSCMHYPANREPRALVSRHTAPLGRWSADSAVAALSEAYRAVLEDTVRGMTAGDAGVD